MELYAAPNTRAIRTVWLLEELGLDYQLKRVDFQPTTAKFFIQATPTGKIPTLVDGDVTLCESGAIAQYVLERYGDGGLVPAVDSPAYAAYLQWFHYAEATAFAPLGIVVWLSRYRDDAAEHAQLLADARQRVVTTLQFLEDQLTGPYLVGAQFTAADVQMGFTLWAAQQFDLLGELPRLVGYLQTLSQRTAFETAMARLQPVPDA